VQIPARDEGRVERRLLLPGAPVNPSTVLIELSNPQIEQELADAKLQLKAAEAEYANLKVQLETQRLDQEAAAAQVDSEFRQAKAKYEADQQLADAGLLPMLELTISRVTMESLEKRVGLEQERINIRNPAVVAQLAAQQARIDQLSSLVGLRQSQLDRLRVRAGINGVLQQLDVEVGQLVTPGTPLARVSDPTRLKANIRVAETQAKDIQIGQRAEVDTRNGIIPGSVYRIDPAVIEGTVVVEVQLEGELPKGARPDLSVDGRIELERLDDVITVGRPVYGQPHSSISLFKIEADGQHASLRPVKLGVLSVNEAQVVEGLQVGDEVVLSDMSAWDSYDRIRLD